MVNTANGSSTIPHIPITVEECELELGALKILEVLRPNWRKECITLKVLTDGLCNKLLKCNLQDLAEHHAILVRVYGIGTDLIIDRNAETQNILLLNGYELAPQLYATFENGLAYEFVPGCTLTVETVACENIYKLVTKRLAQFHRVKLANNCTTAILWEKLENYCNLLPERFSDDYKDAKFKLLKLSKQDLLKEIAFMKKTLSKLDSKVVFAHNDLLLANVIYSKDDNTVKFIDYEYSGPNYQAYDIANHFAEFAGVENVDYSYYPTKEVQCKWLRFYLSEFHGHDNISEKEIYKLYVEVNQFVLVSHIFWGLWGLIQAEYSSIDFDYMNYAIIRFNEYLSNKDGFLALQLPT